jgi:hypothetical protein
MALVLMLVDSPVALCSVLVDAPRAGGCRRGEVQAPLATQPFVDNPKTESDLEQRLRRKHRSMSRDHSKVEVRSRCKKRRSWCIPDPTGACTVLAAGRWSLVERWMQPNGSQSICHHSNAVFIQNFCLSNMTGEQALLLIAPLWILGVWLLASYIVVQRQIVSRSTQRANEFRSR